MLYMLRRGLAAKEFQKSDKSSTDVTRPGGGGGGGAGLYTHYYILLLPMIYIYVCVYNTCV